MEGTPGLLLSHKPGYRPSKKSDGVALNCMNVTFKIMLGSVKRDAFLRAPNVGQLQLRIVDVSCFNRHIRLNTIHGREQWSGFRIFLLLDKIELFAIGLHHQLFIKIYEKQTYRQKLLDINKAKK